MSKFKENFLDFKRLINAQFIRFLPKFHLDKMFLVRPMNQVSNPYIQLTSQKDRQNS